MNWKNIKYEDIQTPVFLLDRGVQKLLKYGMATFMKYVTEAELSYCDINRCIGKVRVAYGKTEYNEIPCPPEMRQQRLDCYTKFYGYSLEKAQRIIKQVDEFYHGNQSIPCDLQKLSRDVLKEIPKPDDREQRISELRRQAQGIGGI